MVINKSSSHTITQVAQQSYDKLDNNVDVLQSETVESLLLMFWWNYTVIESIIGTILISSYDLPEFTCIRRGIPGIPLISIPEVLRTMQSTWLCASQVNRAWQHSSEQLNTQAEQYVEVPISRLIQSSANFVTYRSTVRRSIKTIEIVTCGLSRS